MAENVGLVVADYHEELLNKMQKEAEKAAEENNAEITEVIKVPGAFDTPLAARKLASRKDIDCVAVLGAIIEGDTDHDKIIGHSTAKTLQEITLETETPVTLGINGPGMSSEEAFERIENGYSAVESALRLVDEISG
ncbi:MAG: 6,7-dimethyl-8-ribityllumazine synthase [Candidatus Nanohalobium sp.]